MSRRSISVSAAALLLIAASTVAVLQIAAPKPLNVIVLTVESIRADAFGAERTPRLWAAAEEGTRFTGHRAVSAWTAANIVSLLTGLSPLEHDVHTRGRSLAPEWRTPLEDLAERGWRVGGLQPFMQVQVFDHLGVSVTPGEPWQRWVAEAALSFCEHDIEVHDDRHQHHPQIVRSCSDCNRMACSITNFSAIRNTPPAMVPTSRL